MFQFQCSSVLVFQCSSIPVFQSKFQSSAVAVQCSCSPVQLQFSCIQLQSSCIQLQPSCSCSCGSVPGRRPFFYVENENENEIGSGPVRWSYTNLRGEREKVCNVYWMFPTCSTSGGYKSQARDSKENQSLLRCIECFPYVLLVVAIRSQARETNRGDFKKPSPDLKRLSEETSRNPVDSL